MNIRIAKSNDLGRILEIYEYARQFMRETGNPNQWKNRNPPEATLVEDIKRKRLYVMEDENMIHGVFMFEIAEDPTYLKIYDGSWISEQPYGVIHRIAGDGTFHGVLQTAVDFCLKRIDHLRIDTHEDNVVMQKAITKCGFERCGIIHIEDGSERIAYEKIPDID